MHALHHTWLEEECENKMVLAMLLNGCIMQALMQHDLLANMIGNKRESFAI